VSCDFKQHFLTKNYVILLAAFLMNRIW